MPHPHRRLLLALASAAPLSAGLPAQTVSPPSSVPADSAAPLPAASYVAHRVYDSKQKRFIDFETLVARLAAADLVFIGEQHDDPATHRMELAVLEGLARRRDSVVLALEMFERDVQGPLDRYLAGHLEEAAFLADARPWKNYAADYRPLVELARSRGWPVLASNVPRRHASLVARAGLAGLDTLAAEQRPELAAELSCPADRYFERFTAELGDLSAHRPGVAPSPEEKAAMLRRTYEAQCLKDETMGESVVRAWRPGTLVVHYNGAFHTDFGLGTAERARRRARDARSVVVSAIPVADLDRLEPTKEERKRADYLLFVLAPPKPDTAARWL